MTRARPCLLLPLLALAACATERKPLMGYDKPPPGILVEGPSRLMVWALFDLPPEAQTFRFRLDGQDAVVSTSDNDHFYDYYDFQLQGWTGGWDLRFYGAAAGAHILEIVDSAGQSWAKSGPLNIPPDGYFADPSIQYPAVIFTHYEGQRGSWIVDPRGQDADAATDEITVTNLVHEDVVVERCLIAAGARTSCTPVGTVAPGADFSTVERIAVLAMAMDDHQALFIHLASDASQSYQRDLVTGVSYYPDFGASCQMERIIVHGTPPSVGVYPGGGTAFALSSCYGYATGPANN
jgi:hypothetical protein